MGVKVLNHVLNKFEKSVTHIQDLHKDYVRVAGIHREVTLKNLIQTISPETRISSGIASLVGEG